MKAGIWKQLLKAVMMMSIVMTVSIEIAWKTAEGLPSESFDSALFRKTALTAGCG